MHQPVSPSLSLRFVPYALQVLLATHSVLGGLMNITVDDASPSPLSGAAFSYAPGYTWNQGNGCASCAAKPNASLAYNHTWHDATFVPSMSDPQAGEAQTATLQFNGSAIYVYGIIQPAADYTFFIDGEKTGNFTFIPSVVARTFTYSVLLYSNTSIPQGSHSFVMQNGGSANITSLALLDYAIYTTVVDDDHSAPSAQSPSSQSGSSQSNSSLTSTSAGAVLTSPSGNTSEDGLTSGKSNTSTIVAATIPSVVAILVLIALLFFWRRQRRLQENTNDTRTRADLPQSSSSNEPVMRALPVFQNGVLQPYMVGRDPGNIPPQKGYASDTITDPTLSPVVLSSREEELSGSAERESSTTSASRFRTAASEVSSVPSVPPSWVPGSEPPPAYGAR